MFAFDKPAGSACTHLEGHQCRIHARLDKAGFGGCVRYQCDGAGQRVVQELFAGQSWQQAPGLLPAMLAAFADMRQVHAWLALLESAKALPLPEAEMAQRAALEAALMPDTWTADALAEFTRSNLPAELRAFFKSLSAYIDKGAAMHQRGMP